MTSVSTLWAFSAQPITRERRARGQRRTVDLSDPADADVESSDDAVDEFLESDSQPRAEQPNTSHAAQHYSVLAEQAEDRRWLRSTNVVARAGSTQQTAELRTQQRIVQEARRAARGQHLPWRGDVAEETRILRVLKGIPPLGSTADADQLSDWEEALDSAKMQRVRYGEKDIVQIGRRRTLAEEELSHHEDDIQRHTGMGITDLTLPSDTFGSLDGLPSEASRWTESVAGSFSVPRVRPRRSLPQRWTPQRGPAAAAAAAAIDAVARETMATSPLVEDLDAEIDDFD